MHDRLIENRDYNQHADVKVGMAKREILKTFADTLIGTDTRNSREDKKILHKDYL